MMLCDVPLGSIITVYVSEDGYVSGSPKNNTVRTTVVARYRDGERVTALLLGWNTNYDLPVKHFGYNGRIPTDRWDIDQHERPRYRYDIIDNIHDYKYALWLNDAQTGICVGIVSDASVQCKIVPSTHFPMPYIAAKDIRAGDTIAWMSTQHNSFATLDYAIVSDVSEGEDEHGESIVVLEATVYCEKGLRSYPQGCPMKKDAVVVLIAREKNTP
jgi:hypothetical protein